MSDESDEDYRGVFEDICLPQNSGKVSKGGKMKKKLITEDDLDTQIEPVSYE